MLDAFGWFLLGLNVLAGVLTGSALSLLIAAGLSLTMFLPPLIEGRNLASDLRRGDGPRGRPSLMMSNCQEASPAAAVTPAGLFNNQRS